MNRQITIQKNEVIDMTKEFWKATGRRALKTVCQTLASMLPVGYVITPAIVQALDWTVMYVVLAWLGTGLLAGIASVLTSIATGLPEVEYKQNMEMNIPEPAGSYTEKHMTAEELDALRKEIGGEQNV